MTQPMQRPAPRPETLVHLLIAAAEERGDDLAYSFLADGERETERLTWRQLDTRAREIALELQELGAGGERVLLLLPPGLDFIAAFFGCLYAGAVAVPTETPRSRRTLPRLSGIAADASPAVAVTSADSRRRFEGLHGRVELAPRWLTLGDGAAAPDAAAWRPPPADGDSLAFLQYTSGSTSAPKGVRITHANLLHNGGMIRRAFQVSRESVIVGWLPLFHDMGLIGNVLQPLYAGARCHLMSPMAFLARPLRWLQAITDHGATISGGPDFAYALCARRIGAEDKATLDLSSWQVAFNGAEPVRPETLESFSAAFAECGFRSSAFYPCYGLAEATLFVTGGAISRPATVRRFVARELEQHRVRALDAARGDNGDTERRLVGCGEASGDQLVLIVDPETRRPAEPDRIGEIWIAGESVSRGYWGRPGLTRSDLAARLDGTPASGPFLRTGDLGLLLDGELFVVGRLKDLIIVRGRNHHPQDVERTVEEAHGALSPGGSAAFSVEVAGEERLVVLAEIHRHARDDTDTLAQAVRRAVTEHHELRIHEVVLIRTGTLPRTSSGKVRRHACRSAYLDGTLPVVGRSVLQTSRDEATEPESPAGARREAPLPGVDRDPRLEHLRPMVARHVGLPSGDLDPYRALTAQGLDSLSAVELEHALRQHGGTTITAAELLAGATLAEIVDGGVDGGTDSREHGTDPGPGLVPAETPGDTLLSIGQEALWFLHRVAPRSTAYHITAAARVRPGLDVPALVRALAALARRHAVLRTTFHEVSGEPRQRVHPELTPELLTEDAASLDEGALRNRMAQLGHRPFDLGRGSLLRLGILRREGEDVVVLAIHHIIADFWSLAVMLRELETLYRSEREGESASLPPLSASYGDFVSWERRRMAGARGEALWRWWREHLAARPAPLELPTDRPRPAAPTGRGSVATLVLSRSELDAAQTLARAGSATLFTTLLSILQALVGRHTGRLDFLVGSPSAGRDLPELTPLLGYFVNTLALRADLSDRPDLLTLLARTRQEAAAVFAHRGLPYALLTERLGPERAASRESLVQVVLALQQPPPRAEPALAGIAAGWSGVELGFGSHRMESLELPATDAPFELVMRAAVVEDQLVLSLQYAADLYDRVTVERLLRHFRRLLAAGAADPRRPLDELPWLDSAERRQLTEWGTGPKLHEQDSALVPARCARAARERPDAPAVASPDGWLSHGALNRRANRLARRLRHEGVRDGSRVGVVGEPLAETFVAMLAVLKAGAAYVPLDPAYPRDRLKFMIRDAGVAFLVGCNSAGLPARPPACKAIDLTAGEAASESDTDPDWPAPAPDELAYVIYTSGSTGRPKGVAISHRSLRTLVDWHVEEYRLTPEDRVTQIASLSFDAAVWEIWPALAVGALVHVPDRETRLRPVPLVDWLAERRVTRTFLPTPLAEEVLEELEDERRERPLLALGALLTGGDRLRRRPPAGFAIPVVNHYGPTESTVVTTAGTVDPAGAGLPSIGRPILGTRVTLLDAHGTPVPAGAVGEIAVAGSGLARGYLARPAETARRFVPHASGSPGERLYRTGDLGRWSAAGELVFLQRADDQVKVRGQRIELGEIEAVLGHHPAVAAAAVVPRPDLPDGGLAAFLVRADPEQEPPGEAELADFLRRRLPETMVPARYVPLQALPVTPNGKVDRGALASQTLPRTAPRPAGRARTTVEEEIASLLGELLGRDHVSLAAGFFDLGGHSLLATRLAARVRDVFGVELPLQAVFEAPSLRDLAHTVESEVAGDAAGPEAKIPRRERRAEEPLSFSQQRLWLLDRTEPARAGAYQIPAAVDLHGALDVPALARTIEAIVSRHEVLRTRFPTTGGRPAQVVDGAVEGLRQADLAGLPPVRREAEALRLETEAARRPFDLARGPLLRALLVRREERRSTLVIALHHIVSDGWSMEVLLQEIESLYTAFAEGSASPLASLPVQYADYAVWQRAWLEGAEMERLLAYWRRQLAAPPVLELPTDRPPGSRERVRAGLHRRRLQAAETAVASQTRRHGLTPFMLFAAAWATLLSRLTGQEDVVLGTPVANRRHTEVESLIGFFVNTLALRIDLGRSPGWAEILHRTRNVAVAAYAHQDLPFERLVEELAQEHDVRLSPLIRVLLVQQSAEAASLDLPGIETRIRPLEVGTAKFDLTLRLRRVDGHWAMEAEYDSDLFDEVTIRRWLAYQERLLIGGAAVPEGASAPVGVLAAAERHQVLTEWNDTGRAPTADGTTSGPPPTVHDRFAAQAARTPRAVAVACGDAEMTYGDLDEHANRLANHLHALGVGPESRVGLCLRRRPEQIVALLAILKAGGAFVPIDGETPLPRAATILAEAGAEVLVSDSHFRETHETLGRTFVSLDGDAEAIAARPPRPPQGTAAPESLAYVLFTSGSTGVPKGVMVEHRSLVHLSEALSDSANRGLTGPRRVAVNAPLIFDASVKQWLRLLHGDRLELIPEEVRRDARRTVTFLARREVNVLDVTPTQLRYLLRSGLMESCGEALDRVLVGGEDVHPDLWRELATDPERRFRNLYGPTECTVDAAWAPVHPEADRPLLGAPLPGVRLHVVDRELRPSLPGTTCELAIGGGGVARGYLGRPRTTAERFVPSPWPDAPGARLYRSGDRVRQRADGRLEFVGRLDRQVKLRGFRLELEEIEAALHQHEAVREAAATVRTEEGPEPTLVAYAVSAPGTELAPEALASWLGERLPPYSVPAAFVTLDRLPRTPSGKVDRRALPAPRPPSSPDAEEAPDGAPRTALEEVLAGMMAEVLGVERVGIHDDFFELGGHSLLAAELNALVTESFEIELPMFQILLQSPTVASIAEFLVEDPERRRHVEEMAPVLLELAEMPDDPPDRALEGGTR